MKHLITLALLAAACGAPPEYLDAAGINDAELGSTAQPYISLNGQTTQWGTRQSLTHFPACNKTSTTQNCTFAKFKKIEIAYNTANFTASQRILIDGVRSGLQAAYPGWTFTTARSSDTPALDAVRLFVSLADVPTDGFGDIADFRDVQFTSSVSLSEGANGGFPVGIYRTHGACPAQLDLAAIQERGANATERNRLLQHALGSAAIVCMGVGTRSGGGAVSQRELALGQDLAYATPGEACRANYATNNTTDFSTVTQSACGSD